tara:strand:+ start:12303 stop:12509 length:207 start_codon:yes stop_codon:yes gene_type:complete
MKYIYVAPDCPRCHTLMCKYDKEGIKYEERSADRLTSPDSRRDQIDIDAFVQLSMQNMVLPVEVDDGV